MIEVNEQLAEVISNSRVAFINGQMAEAFKLAKEAIKLDENCADAYQACRERYQMYTTCSSAAIV